MTRIAVVLVVAGSLALAAADSKPNFTGRWELDAKASDFGPAGPEKRPRVIEVIEHHDPDMQIERTLNREEGESRAVLKFRTDGTEVENALGSGTIKSTTKWEGNKLITDGHMEGAPPLREIREMDDKGRMVEVMDYKTDTESGTIRLVFVKK